MRAAQSNSFYRYHHSAGAAIDAGDVRLNLKRRSWFTLPGRNHDVIRLAACVCGSLKVRCKGDPMKVSLCHCLDCQRRTGSTYGVAAFFRREDVEPQGATRSYTRRSDSGHPVTFHFCPQCGSTVFWSPHRKPDTVAVAVGAFADPTFPAPAQAVYADRRHRWVIFETEASS
jgi:hypothetical protein